MNVHRGYSKAICACVMSSGASFSPNSQLSPKGIQVKETVGITGSQNHNNSFVDFWSGNDFKWVLSAILDGHRTTDNVRSGWVKDVQIIVVGRSAQGVRPKESSWRTVTARLGDSVIGVGAEKMKQSAFTRNRSARRAAIGEISLPRTGSATIQVAGVAGRRKVKAAVGGNRVDCLSFDVVLKWRFVKVTD